MMHSTIRIGRLCAVVAALAASGLAGSAGAQGFPVRPVRLVVPSAPGAAADILARVIAPEMSKFLGQSVYVENKTGAASQIGFEFVAKQVPADGHTAVIAAVTGLAILPLTVKDLRFDPIADLAPVVGLVETILMMGSPSKVPWKTLDGLVAYAKANPGKLNQGSSNATVRFWMDAMVRDLGIDVVFVPYRDSGGYFQALQTGEVHMGFVVESSAISMGDKFQVLALTGERRHPRYPNVPTFAELGYPRIRGVNYALSVAAATPRTAIERLHDAAVHALGQPEVRARLQGQHMEIDGGSTEAARKRLAEESAVLAEIAKSSGVRPQ